MKNIYLVTILFFLAINQPIYAQSEAFPLWENSIPGEVHTRDYEEKKILKDGELSSTSQITIPTISVYKPEAEKTNGTAIVISRVADMNIYPCIKKEKKLLNGLLLLELLHLS